MFQVASLVLLLLISAAPAMACMLPDAPMTEQERACCRMMKGDCGQMTMPAGHDCCKRPARVGDQGLMEVKAAAAPPLVVFAAYVAMLDVPRRLMVDAAWVRADGAPPPESPPRTISILRV